VRPLSLEGWGQKRFVIYHLSLQTGNSISVVRGRGPGDRCQGSVAEGKNDLSFIIGHLSFVIGDDQESGGSELSVTP
jgi:hypothetical protein